MVATSLLQSGMDNEVNKDNFINNYGTIVAYFNSLKILSAYLEVIQSLKNLVGTPKIT